MRKFVCALALATASGLPALRSRVEKEASLETHVGRRAPLFGIIDGDELPGKKLRKTQNKIPKLVFPRWCCPD